MRIITKNSISRLSVLSGNDPTVASPNFRNERTNRVNPFLPVSIFSKYGISLDEPDNIPFIELGNNLGVLLRIVGLKLLIFVTLSY